jgi:Mn2+/Fe2+ NRAMP family transporter
VAVGAGHSFNQSLREAPLFHLANVGMAAIAGLIVLIPGMPLLQISLNANLLATVLMPPAMVFLLILANDRDIMGGRVNGRVGNLIAIVITMLVTLAGSASAFVSFVQTFH